MKSVTEIRRELTAKATRDGAFRASLIADPKGTVSKEYDVTLPEEMTITVLEDTATTAHLILPQPQKLSEEDLQQVTGMFNGGSRPATGKDSPY